jgi:hypothetical protein
LTAWIASKIKLISKRMTMIVSIVSGLIAYPILISLAKLLSSDKNPARPENWLLYQVSGVQRILPEILRILRISLLWVRVTSAHELKDQMFVTLNTVHYLMLW